MEKIYKAGDTVKTQNTSLAVVADMSKVKFDMQVDEMNIHSIQVGLPVLVTADAVAGTFDGIVTNVGLMGTQSSGVTTYTVTVEVEEYGMLLPGMNISAEIICESAENVLALPINYISRGNMVLISTKDAGKYKIAGDTKSVQSGEILEMDTGYDGYVYLSVEIGMSNGQYVEIISGLQEDTEVFMQVVTSNTQNNTDMSQFGGMSPDVSFGNSSTTGITKPTGMNR